MALLLLREPKADVLACTLCLEPVQTARRLAALWGVSPLEVFPAAALLVKTVVHNVHSKSHPR